jgi:hypothetical protein
MKNKVAIAVTEVILGNMGDLLEQQAVRMLNINEAQEETQENIDRISADKKRLASIVESLNAGNDLTELDEKFVVSLVTKGHSDPNAEIQE